MRLLFVFVFLSSVAFGQTTAIPDANFEQALIDLGYDTGTTDGSVPTANISGVDSLDLSYKNISDLTGIEDFIALTYLDCAYNQLTSLDMSQNPTLTTLICVVNQLTSIDVSQNPTLTTLQCGYNQLTSIDVSQNIALTNLGCAFNQLTSLDMSQNPTLTTLICGVNQLTSIDVSQNIILFNLQCGENQINFLDVSNNNALTNLGCAFNQLNSLNVGNNVALTDLDCTGNQLSSLDVNNNSALTWLGCSSNLNLTSLNLTNNQALITLLCDYNQLSFLDVSNNTALKGLDCRSNNLTCLNLKNGNNINMGYFNATSNSNLSCIEVDDAVWSTSNWINDVDAQASFNEDCNNACSSTTSLPELTTSKNIVKILDMLGRETSFKTNTPLIYVYDDGSTEKVFSVEH